MSSLIAQRLSDLNIKLPAPAVPAGNYLPWRIHNNTLYVAGMISMVDGKMTHSGKVGAEQTVESGYASARVCALNAIAIMQLALGSLDRVEQVLIVNGFVNAINGFADSPQVINGASDVLVEVFGDSGKHARAAVAVAGLPRDSTVEVQITAAIKPVG